MFDITTGAHSKKVKMETANFVKIMQSDTGHMTHVNLWNLLIGNAHPMQWLRQCCVEK